MPLVSRSADSSPLLNINARYKPYSESNHIRCAQAGHQPQFFSQPEHQVCSSSKELIRISKIEKSVEEIRSVLLNSVRPQYNIHSRRIKALEDTVTKLVKQSSSKTMTAVDAPTKVMAEGNNHGSENEKATEFTDIETIVIKFTFNTTELCRTPNRELYSGRTCFRGAKWHVGVELLDNDEDGLVLGVYLFCSGGLESTVFNTIYNARLMGRHGVFCIGGRHKFTGNDPSGWGWDSFIDWRQLTDRDNGFISPVGNVQMEIEFSADRITEIDQKELARFSASSNLTHDAVLRIKNVYFHVNKGMLSLYSPFFNTLFNSNFREKHENEVYIDDTEPEDFIHLLNAIYPMGGRKVITEGNVEVLLRLADRFLVSDVTERCEKFVIKSPRFSLGQKLLMAYDYHLIDLQQYCLAQCKSKSADILIMCRTMEYKLLDVNVKLMLWEHSF